MEDKTIVHQICSSVGGGESSYVELRADCRTGETELVITKTIYERYPITDIDKVLDLHKRMNGGGGRKKLTLEDFTR